ncbi:MAG: hypothetical protein D6820_13685 [Lentisphaerae bacterium]|nr:MAG: hypothetical protein D6820_13685 [Lentisphaerota bacterium]
MMEFLKRCVQCFGSGFLGGLASSFCFILFERTGLLRSLGVAYVPGVVLRTYRERGELPWLYENLFLASIFGLLFLLPWVKSPQTHRGMVYALVPIALDLLYVLPTHGYGLFGLKLGGFTFAFVFLLHAIWGLVAVSFAPQSSS